MIHCQFCQQAFVMEKYLASHITRVHKEEKEEMNEKVSELSKK